MSKNPKLDKPPQRAARLRPPRQMLRPKSGTADMRTRLRSFLDAQESNLQKAIQLTADVSHPADRVFRLRAFGYGSHEISRVLGLTGDECLALYRQGTDRFTERFAAEAPERERQEALIRELARKRRKTPRAKT
jgi:hypothetical protein